MSTLTLRAAVVATLLTAGSALATPSASAAPFDLVGWATQGGGTTGGGNASPVTVTSSSALISAMQSSSPAVIRVSGSIALSGMQKVAANKTIIGAGSGAAITGGGLNISKVSNVIVRNIDFRGWGDDAINVQYSTRVWIDHNSFSNGNDGAVDVKRASDYVTVSWNKFSDHDKSRQRLRRWQREEHPLFGHARLGGVGEVHCVQWCRHRQDLTAPPRLVGARTHEPAAAHRAYPVKFTSPQK